MTDRVQAAVHSDPAAGPGDPAVLRRMVEQRLTGIAEGFGAASPELGEAMAKAILAPGKRFRALLMLMVAEATGGVTPAALDAAVAVEIVHAASLIVDDLPAMDNAALRRGRPTIHIVHGPGRAILAAIALLAEAFRLLAGLPGCGDNVRAGSAACLALHVGHDGLCAGQDMDLHAPKSAVSVAREHELKTGALFEAGFRLVSLVQGHEPDRAEALAGIGSGLGQVFQSFDDLRDVAGTTLSLGKDQGLDSADSSRAKGILAVTAYAEAVEHYRRLGNDLDRRVAALWFDTRHLRRHIRTILPDDPADGPPV